MSNKCAVCDLDVTVADKVDSVRCAECGDVVHATWRTTSGAKNKAENRCPERQPTRTPAVPSSRDCGQSAAKAAILKTINEMKSEIMWNMDTKILGIEEQLKLDFDTTFNTLNKNIAELCQKYERSIEHITLENQTLKAQVSDVADRCAAARQNWQPQYIRGLYL